MSDVDFVHIEKELVIVNGQRVGAIIVKNDGNVLTNIRIEEDERGNGYARDAFESWLERCVKNGFEKAYVVNVNHGATDHIVNTLGEYESEEVDPRKVPADIKSGVHISDTCYKIHL